MSATPGPPGPGPGPPGPDPGPDLPCPPFHRIPGLPNFRDIGGYPAAGSAVRRGVVFRSSEPSRLTDDGAARLRALGIRTVYDLRSEPDLAHGFAVREWPGARRVSAPVFTPDDYSPPAVALRCRRYASEGAEGFTRQYAAMLAVAARPDGPMRAVLGALARPPPDPVPAILVHCTAGKDRTGLVCAVILALCGVADPVVAHEYALTDLGLAARRPEFVADLLRHPAVTFGRDGAERMVRARKENMLLTLALLRETYGSVEHYAKRCCGLTDADVAQLRRNMVVDLAPGEQLVDWEAHARLLDAA